MFVFCFVLQIRQIPKWTSQIYINQEQGNRYIVEQQACVLCISWASFCYSSAIFKSLWLCISQYSFCPYPRIHYFASEKASLGKTIKMCNFYISTLKKLFRWKGLLSVAPASVCIAGKQNNLQFCLFEFRKKENTLLQIMRKTCCCFNFWTFKWLKIRTLASFSLQNVALSTLH